VLQERLGFDRRPALNSLVGHTPLGKTITGKLNNGNGSFTDATVILFSGSVTPQ